MINRTNKKLCSMFESCKCYGKKIKPQKKLKSEMRSGGEGVDVMGMVREGLTKKVAFEQRK